MVRRRHDFHRWWLPQLLLGGTVLALLAAMAVTVTGNMALRAMTVSLGFLDNTARFPIAESVMAYSPVDGFAWAFATGLGNTLLLTATIIVASILLGIPLALARRSGHLLARLSAGAFVDGVRNTPLVIQLLFWYGVITVSLPSPRSAFQPLSGIFLTDRGLHVTTLGITGTALPLVVTLTIGLVATATLAWRGRLHQASIVSLGTVVVGATLWLALDLGLRPDVPRLGRYNFVGGLTVTPELAAVLLGSVLYASGFAAEIVRAGLAAVPAGQWDAARAMGLNDRQSLRLVIVPQALRIMLPPMTNQFVSVLKNSTLALVVGYPELNSIANTTMNHTGHALECMLVLVLAYLTLAGGISLAMNALDRRTARWTR
ncbi:ABC transporter permease subunit [Novosphingobium sp. AP12]|uniref:ABC transporter permease subunit n=1 Tax=Novosphingobium sp. AP12 TaxID=1144305 RepID=UPI0002721EEB|nr:ABC transporter permease subunit [Novosphingobium sp. AP12]EJL27984.1 ABC-type amino acid transport system, permease component [Novosphingobium sp. AP12]